MTATAAKPPKPMRMNQRAMLVPAAQYARWHELASATAGLTKDELTVLSAVVGYYQLLHERGYASSPTIEEMADSARVRSIDITSAIRGLIGRCLLAVRPGSGRWRNEYLPALPRRVAATLATAADADDGPPL